jgi:putative transposase
MNIPIDLPRLKGFRYPREIIAFAVWAHPRLALSTANVEDLLAARGVIVGREAISTLGQSLWSTLCKLHSPGSTTAERQVAHG